MISQPIASDEVLVVRAGRRALERIRAHGLDPADVEIIPGAAGGPKGLGIAGLDEAVFGTWLPRAPRVRHLIGASVGAWRFAAACRADAVAGLRDLAREYSAQKYPLRPSRRFITDYAREMLTGLFAGREREILENGQYRLHILAVRGFCPRNFSQSESAEIRHAINAMTTNKESARATTQRRLKTRP